MGKPSGSTLATWLSDLEVDRLERVLAARPDAVSPPEPRSFGELADRLQRPASVAPVLPGLALPHLQVAEALAALGPVPCAALADLLDATRTESARGLDAALEALADRALVWPDGEGLLRMATPLRQAWDAPLGLDAPLTGLLADTTSEELRRMLVALGIPSPGTTKKHRLTALLEHHSNPERVASVITSAPASTRKLLERRASHQGEQAQSPARLITFRAPSADSEPGARWALERGLLVQDRYPGYGSTRMPAEVALALRGVGWHAPFEPVPPAVRTASVTSAEVDREAAAAATAFAAHAASVLATCSAAPPVLLKSGGVGARELSRISKAAQCDDIVVRLVLETAYDAGLLARDGDRVAATDGYDTWAEREPAEQLTALIHTWRTLPLTPAQARDEDGKVLPALAGTPPCGGCIQAREGLLAAAAEFPAHRGVHSPAELGPMVAWHRPLAEQLPQDTTPFATAIREAELLGVVARGCLSPIGAALRADDTEAAETLAAACERLLPAATRAARFGADLTAVVTGTPSARLAALLDTVADKEVGGTASVWRFSPTTVRRALDTGRTADAIAADLGAVAVGALPQPLLYLINDSARTHGRVRIAPAACVIHGEEAALLAELVTHRKLAALGLRVLAPTVLVSRTPLDKTLAALRAAGYAPVAERADGTVRVEKTRRRRAAAPVPVPPLPGQRQRSVPTVTQITPVTVDLSTLAARLRAAPPTLPAPDPFGTGVPYGTDTEEIVAAYAKNLAYSDVRQLAHAVDVGTAITVEYVAASGNRTVRILSELVLDPPYLYAWCHLRDDERVFALSRIHGIMPG
ncbi:helicase-associated domain-containing protein [Streptomyces sp. NBC_01185]|uniref:helicase-associated domain-containing protein n=1 Tax=Streptomyces sp. NBC_01185 TaxID=2903764 RepID=UPI00386B2001|nr:helicase-associated domain-containing protein [Streptomyces sp. NBC_01185]